MNAFPFLRFAAMMLAAAAPVFGQGATAQSSPPDNTPAQTTAQPNRPALFIKGTVRDATGAPIAEAAVILEERTASDPSPAPTAKGSVVEGKTLADGTFSFLSLRDGTFVLRARKPGMREAATAPMELSTGQTKQIDLVLKPLKKTQKGLTH